MEVKGQSHLHVRQIQIVKTSSMRNMFLASALQVMLHNHNAYKTSQMLLFISCNRPITYLPLLIRRQQM